MGSPGLSFPSFSAASILEMEPPSLIDREGCCRASRRGRRSGRWGVLFRETGGGAASEGRSAAAGDRREDGDRVAVLDLGVERTGEAHVLVVDVDVHEAVQLALLGDEAVLQARVLGVEVVDERGPDRKS